ncbi:MAG: cytochrome c, partial [Rhodoferax sp.]|nr:cytochrome c [Rhodoferax sp.]
PAPYPPVPQQSAEQSTAQSTAQPTHQSAEWNRGAYLVTGLGHCGACHTPRNALGAEQGGSAFLSGAWVDAWEAPALTMLSQAPLPWSSDALFQYLRHGHSAEHGMATGPMAPVVKELTALPDADIRAMAVYLASFQSQTTASPDATAIVAQAARAAQLKPDALGSGQRLFESACGACHHDGNGPRLLGLNTPLALSSKLHSQHPDNLLHTILHGIQQPVAGDAGFMPAFKSSLSNAQLADLLGYMRQRFAPDKPAWDNVRAALGRVREVQP